MPPLQPWHWFTPDSTTSTSAQLTRRNEGSEDWSSAWRGAQGVHPWRGEQGVHRWRGAARGYTGGHPLPPVVCHWPLGTPQGDALSAVP